MVEQLRPHGYGVVVLGLTGTRVGMCALVFGLLASACSSVDDSADAVDKALSDGPADTADTEVEVLAETEFDDVPGAPVNRFDLAVGECFNEGNWYDEELDRRVDLTASIGCDQPHGAEVYFEAEFPAPSSAPYPGDTNMTEWSTEACYDEFENFVGSAYEVSMFEIGVVQPSRETFEHPVGRHRRVFCYVYEPDGEPMVGTARNIGL